MPGVENDEIEGAMLHLGKIVERVLGYSFVAAVAGEVELDVCFGEGHCLGRAVDGVGLIVAPPRIAYTENPPV